MAGMLPGVEAARRRRFHQGGGGGGIGSPSLNSSSGGPGFTRRPTYCLYATSNETQLISGFSSSKRYGGDYGMMKTSQDVKLGQLAREAKERLDERLLRTQRKLETRRNNSDSISYERSTSMRYINGSSDRTIMIQELETEVFGSTTRKKTKKSNRLFTMKRTWEKLGVGRWKTAGVESQKEEVQQQEEECSICLDSFSAGENLVNLLCAHKFHSRCILPWLQANSQSHCPCCRTLIFTS